MPPSGQKEILEQHHDTIQQYMDIDVIKPYLYQSGLLTHAEMVELLNEPSKVTQIVKVMRWIPDKGDDSLRRLIVCLQKSSMGTGTAHEDLANDLERSLQEWRPKCKCGQLFTILYSFEHSDPIYCFAQASAVASTRTVEQFIDRYQYNI